MKNYFLKAFWFLLAFPVSAFAQFFSPPIKQVGEGVGGGNVSQVGVIIQAISTFLASIIGAISVVMILYAGFKFVTAGDNEDEVGKARKIITYGIVGLLVTAVAYYVPGIVESIIPI